MVHLLAEHREADTAFQHQVVSLGVRRPESVDPARLEGLRGHDLVEQLARVGVELARRGAHLRVVEDGREAALELPGVEEERPVDVRDQRSELGLDHAQAGEGRLLQDVKAEAGAILAGRFQREDGPRHLLRVLQPQLLLQLAVLRIQDRLAPGIE